MEKTDFGLGISLRVNECLFVVHGREDRSGTRGSGDQTRICPRVDLRGGEDDSRRVRSRE